jgi:hypothetical protein
LGRPETRAGRAAARGAGKGFGYDGELAPSDGLAPRTGRGGEVGSTGGGICDRVGLGRWRRGGVGTWAGGGGICFDPGEIVRGAGATGWLFEELDWRGPPHEKQKVASGAASVPQRLQVSATFVPSVDHPPHSQVLNIVSRWLWYPRADREGTLISPCSSRPFHSVTSRQMRAPLGSSRLTSTARSLWSSSFREATTRPR